ncbi:MAG: hypothetical protein Q9191_008012, partial [Dirinaria sp. TL-2023a]
MLYALGSNSNGQLGIGTYEDVSEAKPCIVECDENDPPGMPIKISAGGSHTLLLFDSGILFSAGNNQHGQAGVKPRANLSSSSPDSDTNFTEITFPTELPKVKLCSTTWEASIIITLDDEVYSFGSGPNGELGTGLNNSSNLGRLPRIPPPDETIVNIASGIKHTVVVLSNGDVYGWGDGRKGQLGEPAEIVRAPRKINGAKYIRRATCGAAFTYLVGDPVEGRHIVLGSNKWGVRVHSPTYMRGWIGIGSNWNGIMALTSSGELVTWGRNDRGQLGPSGTARHDVSQLALGSEHTVVLTREGK